MLAIRQAPSIPVRDRALPPNWLPMLPLQLPERLFRAASFRDPSISDEERFAACMTLLHFGSKDPGLAHFFQTTPVPTDGAAVARYVDAFEAQLSALAATNGAAA